MGEFLNKLRTLAFLLCGQGLVINAGHSRLKSNLANLAKLCKGDALSIHYNLMRNILLLEHFLIPGLQMAYCFFGKGLYSYCSVSGKCLVSFLTMSSYSVGGSYAVNILPVKYETGCKITMNK